ncbi:MAG TPA: hypothetical protein VFT31_08375 [Kribbella sp.]|nr:hypothetical protein [Kribbella sp.]
MARGWVAATVRAKAMARRRIGAGAARRIAMAPSLSDGLGLLAGTAYEKAAATGTSLREAERLIGEAELWELRVLAGWVPGSAVGLARALGARYERANIEAHARALEEGAPQYLFQLGSLALSWPRLAATTSQESLRNALASSPWGDPGAADPETLHDVLTLRWLRMVAAEAPTAMLWAAGAAVLVAARLVLVVGAAPTEGTIHASAPLIGTDWLKSSSVAALRKAVPSAGRWALEGVGDPADLWRAEARLAARIESDGFRLLRRGTPGPEPFLGSVAVLAVDGWRLRAALGDAALGAGPGEVFDVVA